MADLVIDGTQFLTFGLNNEEFAVEIAKVHEVIDYTEVTAVPRMPSYLKGVINLRGNVVPVVDLRLKLGMPQTERTIDTCIIIMEVDLGEESIQIGALADSVQEVTSLNPGDIEAPPKIGTSLEADFIKGMGRRGGKFLIILDIDKVLASEEILNFKAVKPDLMEKVK
jgi:purine-binding chemotaxis protein CheW